jgi:hypothetical protein
MTNDAAASARVTLAATNPTKYAEQGKMLQESRDMISQNETTPTPKTANDANARATR